MKELYGNLTSKKKKGYDDTKKATHSFDYQDVANKTLDNMKKAFRVNIDKNANFFGLIRKSGNKLNLSVNFTLYGEVGNFTVMNVHKYKKPEDFVKAIEVSFNKISNQYKYSL